MKRASIVLVIAALLGACGSPPKTPQVSEAAPSPDPVVPSPAPTQPPPPSADASPPSPAPVVDPPAAGTKAVDAAEPAGFREVFPHVRVDIKEKIVQFDGIVPIDAHDENAPWVFLEVVACSPDTKEHEALVMTQAKASHVHAALLLIGTHPGTPGKWKFENEQIIPIAPTGDVLRVELRFRTVDGLEKSFTPQEMIVNAKDQRKFGEGRDGRWVFAGSQMITRGGREWYDADGAGTLVGLTTFGSETIAWSEMISPEAAVEEPSWIADKATVPPAGTAITVTIRRDGGGVEK